MTNQADGFSNGEGFFMVLAIFLGVVPFARWYNAVGMHGLLGAAPKVRRPLLMAIPIGLVILAVVLKLYSASEVRNDLAYQLLFLLGSVLWLNLARLASGVMGLHMSSEIIERNNPASIAASIGVFLSILVAYAGSNIGSGDTISTTLVPAFLGMLGVFFCWFLHEITSHSCEAVTVDRDMSSAVRLGGFLIAVGVIFGNAMSGNWYSYYATFYDWFWKGILPALVLVAIASGLQKALRPSPQNPQPEVKKSALVPALVQILMAVTYVFFARG